MRKTIVMTIAAAALLTGCSSADDEQPTAAEQPPPYTVVSADESGMQRLITVQVDSSERLNAVFQAVIADLDQEAGYIVRIDCSTNPAGQAINRLANGRYAIGNEGVATTGLEGGGSDFEVLPDRTCPAV